MSTPFNVIDELIAQLNTQHGFAFTSDQLNFDEPELINPDIVDFSQPERNSRVRVWRNADKDGPAADFTLNYNRLHLEKLFQLRSLEFADEGQETVGELLEQISARIGLELTHEDVFDNDGFEPRGEDGRSVLLVARDSSLAVFGEVELFLHTGYSEEPEEPGNLNFTQWFGEGQWESEAGNVSWLFDDGDLGPFVEFDIGGDRAWTPKMITLGRRQLTQPIVAGQTHFTVDVSIEPKEDEYDVQFENVWLSIYRRNLDTENQEYLGQVQLMTHLGDNAIQYLEGTEQINFVFDEDYAVGDYLPWEFVIHISGGDDPLNDGGWPPTGYGAHGRVRLAPFGNQTTNPS